MYLLVSCFCLEDGFTIYVHFVRVKTERKIWQKSFKSYVIGWASYEVHIFCLSILWILLQLLSWPFESTRYDSWWTVSSWVKAFCNLILNFGPFWLSLKVQSPCDFTPTHNYSQENHSWSLYFLACAICKNKIYIVPDEINFVLGKKILSLIKPFCPEQNILSTAWKFISAT